MADPTRGKRRRWSYNAGERGRNWVRAYEHPRDGTLYLEWFEPERMTDAESGQVCVIHRRRRRKLGDTDQTRARAVQKAEELAERFAELPSPGAADPITLAGLLDAYGKEVTPTKGREKQGHDQRAQRVFRAFFDGATDPSRRSQRDPATLDRIDWDSFIAARRSGTIAGWKPVKDRQVQYDLKFLIAVLNWGTGARPQGSDTVWLPMGNPWGSGIRRSQRWQMPRTKSPRRPSMTDEIRAEVIRQQPSWQLGAALVLQRDTRRRNSAIRQLDWSDIDQRDWTIRWRGDLDKDGRETRTPLLSEEAKDVLRTAPSRGIAGPVFPSATDPSVPTSRNTFQVWLRRAKRRVLRGLSGVERSAWENKLRGVGFHAEKRAGVRDPEFRSLPPKIQETIAGTRYQTLRDVYDEVTTEDVREAWKARNGGAQAVR